MTTTESPALMKRAVYLAGEIFNEYGRASNAPAKYTADEVTALARMLKQTCDAAGVTVESVMVLVRGKIEQTDFAKSQRLHKFGQRMLRQYYATH